MFQVTAQNCQEKFEVILSELCKENKKSVSSSALPMQTNKILRPRLDKKQFCFCPLLICVWIACFQPDTDIQKLLTSGNRTEMITIRFAGWISGWIAVLFRIRIFGVRSGIIVRFFWIRSRIAFHFCSSRIRIRIIQNVLNSF